MSFWDKGIISLAVMKRAPISDSASEDMTNLIIVAMVRTGTLNAGKGSFYDRKIWEPARLRDKISLRYEASECAAKIVLLAL